MFIEIGSAVYSRNCNKRGINIELFHFEKGLFSISSEVGCTVTVFSAWSASTPCYQCYHENVNIFAIKSPTKSFIDKQSDVFWDKMWDGGAAKPGTSEYYRSFLSSRPRYGA